MVLAGGDAGLRLGEIIALEWRDIDLAARRLTVERSDWHGHVTVPQGSQGRSASPMRPSVVFVRWIAAHHARSRD